MNFYTNIFLKSFRNETFKSAHLQINLKINIHSKLASKAKKAGNIWLYSQLLFDRLYLII